MAVKGATKERTSSRVQEPKRYRVIMHNDDFTTMEFVVEILMDIFRKSAAEAEQLMLFVHQNGKAIVGVYPYDIAKTKIAQTLARARDAGFPFRVTMEESE